MEKMEFAVCSRLNVAAMSLCELEPRAVGGTLSCLLPSSACSEIRLSHLACARAFPRTRAKQKPLSSGSPTAQLSACGAEHWTESFQAAARAPIPSKSTQS